MSLIRGVGAAENFRQRNIFPLPELGPDEGGTTGGDDWRATRVQRRVISHITECYKGTYENIDRNDMAGSLSSLCSSSKTYDTGRSDVQPYVKENVSWPEVSNCPVSLCSCMPTADNERLGAWRKHMLRDVADSGRVDKPVKPYVDPILKNNAVIYGDFLKELSKRNMVKFKIANGEQSNLGVFFVKKKSGQLRLIFDTRRLNESFHAPPTTDLPSADAFTRTEFVEGSQFYIGSGDLANAFYTLAVPNDLAEMFTMPAIEAGKAGIFSVNGAAVEAGTILLPYITVLPMGWSWALHFCQTALEYGILKAGFCRKQFIGDKREAVVLKQTDDLAVAAYVDNFGVFGANRQAVDEGLQKIILVLRGWGLTVHEIEPASLQADFVGLSFDGTQGTVAVKKQRILKIKFAIDELLKRQFCSGRTMQSSEKWRFRFPNAINARHHALGNTDPLPANILNTEARALVWSAEHLLRCGRNFGRRPKDLRAGGKDPVVIMPPKVFNQKLRKKVDRHVTRHLQRKDKAMLEGQIPMGMTYLEVDNILVEYLQDLFDSGVKLDSGIRPGETSNLLVGQVIPPMSSFLGSLQFFAVLLNPSEAKVPGKTGIFDQGILIDSDMWINPILRNLIQNRPRNAPLWSHNHNQILEVFNQAVVYLKLESLGVSMYTLRHGGASFDIMSRRRSMEEVKQRGRWATDSSLRRYVKTARLQSELHKMHPAVIQFGKMVMLELPNLLTQFPKILKLPFGMTK
ncbi:unnamed protein product [Cladocopium goreaui]|uniref:Reverse transcriptase domain-containing protein n=1 Tax=Cladocopium goreaui TaxID=2562237 RepID=A0A9P1CUK7_9DINO|nr:unnamed protein product [Cladocopium goreaui]